MRWLKSALVCLSLALPLPTLPCSAESSSLVHQKRYAMGTVFEIVIYDDDLPRADVAARAALDEVVRLDGMMSDYKPESELSRMNRTAHVQPVRISRELYDVIEQSLFYSRLSDGQFDISVGPVVDLWKAALADGPVPPAEELAAALRCVGYQKIELIPPDRIQFHSDCMRLDLGSIGKGYAVDRVVELLKERNLHCAYIDAGGSTIYALGAPPGANAWNVRLRDPSNRLAPQIRLMNNSVSTSEQSSPSLLQGGDAPGHIVLPGTGKPLQTRYTVSVSAPSATASDALSTTLLLLGPAKGAALVKTLHDVSAIWINSDGERTVAGDSSAFYVAREQQRSGVSQPSWTAIGMLKARKDSPQ
jgi:thiamine biosynthesis lipoprotein